ncbi:MAG: BatA and WFA domain-containing protein, partial [Planctomycetaceae bacterium]|nr:BatA and WFA domain-containing protein [Planctomycetaceae bacterium]
MLTVPWALLGLISLPIVFGIYLFRTRSRRYEVSCLFLWVDRNRATQGGRKIQRLQLPFLIVLEILALILLTVAASQPMFRIESMGRPTVIILDASYSMTAGAGEETSQKRAVNDLHRMFAAQIGSQPIGYPIQFIIAGTKPQLLLGRAKNATEAREILESWHCSSPTADLDTSISLAANISTPGTKILVVTDHLPIGEITEGRVLWKSYGKQADNLAIIHASRVLQDDKDRLLLEIANLGKKTQNLRMSIVESKNQRLLFQQENKALESGQTHLIRTVLPQNTGSIEVRLDKDLLTIDNRLTILPPQQHPVRVQLGSLPDDLADKIKKAVEVSGMAILVRERPEIVFGTQHVETPTSETPAWFVSIVSETDSAEIKPFVGPFVVDHSSPLATGLSLDGIVWSASETREMNGTPIISAGTIPLFTEQHHRNGSRTLTLQINDRLSTLTTEPAFPILIWNILKYRSRQVVGITVNNLKLGTEAEFVPAKGDETIEIKPPQGELQTVVVVSGNPVKIPAEQTGVFRVTATSGTYEFAVGTLSAEESNLLNLTTATIGNWFDEETLRTEFQ